MYVFYTKLEHKSDESNFRHAKIINREIETIWKLFFSDFAGSTKPEAAICDMYADTFADLFNNGMYYKYSPEGAKDFMGPLFTNFCSSALPILDKRLKKTGKYMCGNKVSGVLYRNPKEQNSSSACSFA